MYVFKNAWSKYQSQGAGRKKIKLNKNLFKEEHKPLKRKEKVHLRKIRIKPNVKKKPNKIHKPFTRLIKENKGINSPYQEWKGVCTLGSKGFTDI